MHTRPSYLPFLICLALAALTGCRARTADEKPFVVADLFQMPARALATVELSPTPIPSPTGINEPSSTPAPTLPLPTVVILSQPTLPIGTFGPTPTFSGVSTPTPAPMSCTVASEMPFTPIWQNLAEVQTLLGCPTGSIQQVDGVFQVFEYGLMFWRSSDRSIFVISELNIRQGQPTDSWWRLDDTYQDSEPDSDSSLQPPAGLLQPVRGFGKVWRNNGFIREALGWALSPEQGGASQWQQYEKGWMMTGPGGAPIYALIPLDSPPYSAGVHPGPLP